MEDSTWNSSSCSSCLCSWAAATSTALAGTPHRRPSRLWRWSLWLLGLTLLLAILPAAALTAWQLLPRTWGNSTTTRSGPTLEQIRRLAALVTARATIADAQETVLWGKLGGCKAILVIRGEVLLGPDLSKARIIASDQEAKLIKLELPRPRVISARLDHGATRVSSLGHEGLWMIVPGDAGRTRVLNDAYRQAEEAVARAASGPDLMQQASRHAESVLRDFFATGGWKVEIKWIGSP